MKNFKKISREQLKQVRGAGAIPNPTTCSKGYIYMCQAEGASFPEQGIWDCACGCVPIT